MSLPPPHGAGSPGNGRDAHKHKPCGQADPGNKNASNKSDDADGCHLDIVLTKVDVAVAEVIHNYVAGAKYQVLIQSVTAH